MKAGRVGETKRVFVAGNLDLDSRIREALVFTGFAQRVNRDTRVFLKPNLTWKEHIPGVTTSPRFMYALVEAVKDYTPHITIGEASGGYNTYSADDAFAGHGLGDLARRYGVRLVNLCSVETERVEDEIDLPKFLLHETDVFATVPVPKIHSNTVVSLALKNQWGCIPNVMRLRMHPKFANLIVLVNRALKVKYAFFDAGHILDVSGPLAGLPVEMKLIVAANDPGAGSWACCRIMKIDPWSIRHHRTAQRAGMFPESGEAIVLNQPLEPFATHQFHLKRNLVNWVSYAAFNSNLVTKIVYDSTAADLFHKVLYAVRKNKLAARFLYGHTGPPVVEGRRRG